MDAVDVKQSPISEASQRSRLLGRSLVFAAVALSLFQACRLFWFINRYSVDVPYWDQWDFYKAFFTPHSLWQIFAWQHGPHRQGIGFFLTWLVNELTGWNQRAQCFTIGLVMVAAALATLWLKGRLFGALRWYDLIIVLFVLSLRQWELYAATPNVSHGAMPLLLIVLSCIAWTVGNIYLRYTLVLILGFLATYTGFGMFVGMVNPLLLAADRWQAGRRRSRADTIAADVALLLAVLSLASFYTNYRFAPAVANFKFPDPNWHLYPSFMAFQFAGLVGVLGVAAGTLALGFAIMTGILTVLAFSAARLLRGTTQDAPTRVIFFLLAFAMAFSANAAIGRLCLGLEAAASSRYYPLLVPAALGCYFALLTRPAARDILVFLLLPCTIFATMRLTDGGGAKACRDGKERWIAAYLETEKVKAANDRADFKVYPLTGKQFAARLAWLRENHYSLFRGIELPTSRPAAIPSTAPATLPAVTTAQ